MQQLRAFVICNVATGVIASGELRGHNRRLLHEFSTGDANEGRRIGPIVKHFEPSVDSDFKVTFQGKRIHIKNEMKETTDSGLTEAPTADFNTYDEDSNAPLKPALSTADCAGQCASNEACWHGECVYRPWALHAVPRRECHVDPTVPGLTIAEKQRCREVFASGSEAHCTFTAPYCRWVVNMPDWYKTWAGPTVEGPPVDLDEGNDAQQFGETLSDGVHGAAHIIKVQEHFDPDGPPKSPVNDNNNDGHRGTLADAMLGGSWFRKPFKIVAPTFR